MGTFTRPRARRSPTASTGTTLLDAYLWVKTPGQSGGTCDSAGGARAWDYSTYDPPDGLPPPHNKLPSIRSGDSMIQ